MAYYDEIRNNWKLSFVTIEYELKDNKLELKYTPAKRFSFLVGQDEPTKTYIQQLNPIYESITNPTLSDITNAFSVSRLSKDFYEDYKRKYFELYDYLSKNDTFLKEAERLRYKDKESQKRFITIFCKKGERITIFDTSSISHMPALIRADAILPAQWRKILFSTVPSE